MTYEVKRRARGEQIEYAVFLGPKRIGQWCKNKGAVVSHQTKLIRASVPPNRRCLTCGTPFVSEGPHNRMCGSCRSESMDGDYAIGHY